MLQRFMSDLMGASFKVGLMVMCLLKPLYSNALEQAVDVYASYNSSVFQVRIIELGSGSQSSLGTGFLVVDGQFMASNYHVVSAKVFEPNKYRIEVEVKGEKLALDILAVDVVNDLAILKFQTLPSSHLGKGFNLQPQLPEKGTTLYSFGNPHGIGMTVVEGNFNGLVEHRFVDQIHFSGAINPGMSGGPTLDAQSAVVGVNVATAGNQIGFLVPARALVALIERTPNEVPTQTQLHASMAEQIEHHTSTMVTAALATPWQSSPLKSIQIASSPLTWLECWGDSEQDKKAKTYTISRGCHSGGALFLNQEFNSGFIEYEYLYVEAPTWPSISLYNFMAQQTSHAGPANKGTKKELGRFSCDESEVRNNQGTTARVSYCLRAYKQFPNLYDAFYMAVTTDKKQQALMSHYTLAGVNQASAQAFLAHFVEVAKWL